VKLKIRCLNKVNLTILLLIAASGVFGQLTGTKHIPLDYPTVAAAVTALNLNGVGAGGVTFNVGATHVETISSTISITATGTAGNPIVFQKDPATAGANPRITAYTGGVGTPASSGQDGIWRLVGTDYITIDGIDLEENPVNTANPATMEYGYALYKASTSNGCQFVTIRNCVVTLNNINNALGGGPMVDGSAGIIVMNATATSAVTSLSVVAGGTNSNNRFHNNTIQNCNTGIALIGYAASSPFTLADTDNDVGGNHDSTGNNILNFGGASGAINPAVAIRTLAQYNLNVSHNSINNNDGAGTNHPNILRGIYTNTATSANTAITYNTVTLHGGGTTHHLLGIENAAGSTPAANTIDIHHNTVTNSTYATATTGGFYGIRNAASAATVNMNNNSVTDNSNAANSTGFFYSLLNSGTATNVTMNSNIVSGNSTLALTGLFVGIYNSTVVTNLKINTNTIAGNSTTSSTGTYFAIYNTGAATASIRIDSNFVGNNTTPAFTFNSANSGTQTYISNTAGASTATLSISHNDFQGITYAVTGSGNNTFITNTAATQSQSINANTFTNLNVATTGNLNFFANKPSALVKEVKV